MIRITVEGTPIDLPADFSMEIENTSPIFNDRGSQSIPMTVPASRHNSRIFRLPFRIDTALPPNSPQKRAEVVCGGIIRSGTLNITEASARDGISFNIGFDNSTAYQTWHGMKLSELADLPVFDPSQGLPADGDNDVPMLISYLQNVYEGISSPFAIFPIAVGKEGGSYEMLNYVDGTTLVAPEKIHRKLDDKMTEITVPQGYGLTPFLKVSHLIRIIFENLGVKILRNPFEEDPDLRRLAVLNNTADACCRGYIDYADLLPDCTVEQFLNALWVRFGLVYNVDYDRRTVDMALLRDILASPPAVDLTRFASARENMIWEQNQYVTLQANTGLENAEPATETFDDFIRGREVADYPTGSNVDGWRLQVDESTGDEYWDGDVNDDREDPDPGEGPDPGDGPDPGEDPDRGDEYNVPDTAAYRARAGAPPEKVFIARETVTGKWYLLDRLNRRTAATSSPYFKWDPKPAGLEPLELKSDDECVPLDLVTCLLPGTQSNLPFHDIIPVWLTGCRHYHTYIAGQKEESGEETPLSFLFAYTMTGADGAYTRGRISPENGAGKPLTLSDGEHPGVSLLFDTDRGLYRTYWREYDRILRSGNRYADITVRTDLRTLAAIDMLRPVMFCGMKCLADTVRYTLPASDKIQAEIRLRPIIPL